MDRTKQIVDVIRRKSDWLSPGSKLVVLLVVAIAASLGLLVHSTSTPSTELLFDSRTFTAAELGQIEVAFAKAQLADYTIVGRQIRIPTKKRTEYVSAAAEAGVLESTKSHATDAFNQVSVLENSTTKKARFHHAKEQDLAEAIRELPQVSAATVRVDIQQPHGFAQPTATANVRVECENNKPLPVETVETIRQLVADEFHVLSPLNVGVTDLTSNKPYPAGTKIKLARQPSTGAFTHNEALEQHVQAKVESSLRGYGARVVVNTRLAASNDASSKQLCVYVEVPADYYFRKLKRRSEALTGSSAGHPTADQFKALRAATEAKIQRTTQQLCGEAVVVAVTTGDNVLSVDLPASRPAWSLRDWFSRNWLIVVLGGSVGYFVCHYHLQSKKTKLN
ncbi:MAG: hypothetical protein KDB27_12865, partial [Planctomycetales bacterium]|nr:hypothetical protein [Planctomycetales bacterium]